MVGMRYGMGRLLGSSNVLLAVRVKGKSTYGLPSKPNLT